MRVRLTNNNPAVNCKFIITHKFRRRGSLGLPNTPPKKEIEHPSHFAAMLRRDPMASSMGSLRKDGTLNGPWNARRESLPTNSFRKDFLQVPSVNGTRRNTNRRFSNDSLDGRRNSWDPGRRGSSGSSIGWEDPIWEDKVSLFEYNTINNTLNSNDCCVEHGGIEKTMGREESLIFSISNMLKKYSYRGIMLVVNKSIAVIVVHLLCALR